MTKREADDLRWAADARENGWTGAPAGRLWRLPGIRHVRAMHASYMVEQNATFWASIGIGTGYPAPYDNWVVYGIARGWL